MGHLRATGLDALLRSLTASGKPLLGVCLGCQILLERSEEKRYRNPGHPAGFCRRFDPALTDGGEPLRIPHLGWNARMSDRQTVPCSTASRTARPFISSTAIIPNPIPR